MLIHSPKELALFIVNQRKKYKLSQTEVANKVGLKQKTISAFENKPEGTKIETLFHILSAVNVDMRIVSKDEESTVKARWKEEW